MGQTNGCCHKAAGTVPEIPEMPNLRLLKHGNLMQKIKKCGGSKYSTVRHRILSRIE